MAIWIARSNAAEVKNDTWLRFTDQYPEFRNDSNVLLAHQLQATHHALKKCPHQTTN